MLNKYKIQFDKTYLKDLDKIHKKDREKIKKSVLSLADDPRPNGCKKLKGSRRPLYRIRSGDYRVIYSVEDTALVILVVEVDHRKDVYRW